MKKYSMLTLDLNDSVSTEKRTVFYKELEKRKWKKIDELSTLWYAEWNDNATEQGIISTTKKDVQDSAKIANFEHYDAATAVCGQPVVWKQ